MLNLPQKSINKIKQLLLKQQKQVEEEMKTLVKDDPLLMDALPEASESGTDSFMADVHTRLTVMREGLMKVSKNIQKSLQKLNKGTYGKCERCGKAIEPARLEAMPTAILCMSCSKKPSK